MKDNNKGIKVRDPVCGMLIELGDSLGEAEYNGEKYYFCSNSCKDRFLKKSGQYLAGRNK